MIAIILRDLRWRLLMLLPLSGLLYVLEPGFHQQRELSPDAIALGPTGVSATLSYLALLSMIILLGGSISGDRREGHTRLFFSHPTSPVGYYSLRWIIAYVISIALAVLFLVFGQLIAWGAVLGGWTGLAMPVLSALSYGGVVVFLSAILPRGDGIVALLLVIPTFTPQILSPLNRLVPELRQAILLLIPPHGALTSVWEGLLYGIFSWSAAAFTAAYGVLFLAAAALILRLREWP